MGYFNKPLLSEFRELCRRGRRKIIRASGGGRHQGSSTFQTHRTDVHVNSQRLSACTGPTQTQAIWGPSTERGCRHKHPSPTKQLSLIVNCSQKKTVFSSGVSLGTQTTPKVWPHPSSRWPTQNELTDTLKTDYLLVWLLSHSVLSVFF